MKFVFSMVLLVTVDFPLTVVESFECEAYFAFWVLLVADCFVLVLNLFLAIKIDVVVSGEIS